MSRAERLRQRGGMVWRMHRLRARQLPMWPGRVTSLSPILVARHDATHSLILAYRPGWQSLDDLNTIARHVRDIEPSIEPHIVASTGVAPVTRRIAARLPSLIVSTGRLINFRPLRGKVYQGWPIPKLEELERLAAAGLPVPKTAVLTPNLELDPADWGDFVIVKPTDIATSSHGRGVQLTRTGRVRYIAPDDYPADHPGRLGPMMVQQFIDTGPTITTYRVLTLFGEPLYAQYNVADAARVPLSAPDEEIETSVIALQTAQGRVRELVAEPDVVAMARSCYAALPEIPLQGVDILREHGTGKLYVIEINAGGNTWHFSSRYAAELRQQLGPQYARKRHQQFDAMRTAARVLVEVTEREAV